MPASTKKGKKGKFKKGEMDDDPRQGRIGYAKKGAPPQPTAPQAVVALDQARKDDREFSIKFDTIPQKADWVDWAVHRDKKADGSAYKMTPKQVETEANVRKETKNPAHRHQRKSLQRWSPAQRTMSRVVERLASDYELPPRMLAGASMEARKRKREREDGEDGAGSGGEGAFAAAAAVDFKTPAKWENYHQAVQRTLDLGIRNNGCYACLRMVGERRTVYRICGHCEGILLPYREDSPVNESKRRKKEEEPTKPMRGLTWETDHAREFTYEENTANLERLRPRLGKDLFDTIRVSLKRVTRHNVRVFSRQEIEKEEREEAEAAEQEEDRKKTKSSDAAEESVAALPALPAEVTPPPSP